MRCLGLTLGIALCASCATTRFTVEEPASLRAVPRSPISVLGVVHNGHFDEEYFRELGPALREVLGSDACELGLGDRLLAEDQALYERTDLEVRDNGVTKTAIEPFLARAKGRAVLALTIFGKPPTRAPRQSLRAQTLAPSIGVQRRRRGRMNDDGDAGPLDGAMDLVMALYGVQHGELLAQVSLHYTGTSADDALAQFTAKLKALLPGASCVGWTWRPRGKTEAASTLQ